MKRLIALFILLGCASVLGWGQASPLVAAPVVTSASGMPIAGAKVAICTQFPGATLSPPCGEFGNSLATTYSTSAALTVCTANPVTLARLNGTGCSNPGVTDGLGNMIAYASSTGTLLWYEVYGTGITPFAAPLYAGGIFPLATPGVFTNTQMNQPFVANVGNLNLTNFYQTGTTNVTTDAWVGAIKIPAGMTAVQGNGLSGYVQSNCDSGGALVCNGVALFGVARANVNNSAVWSFNGVMNDMPGTTGTFLTNELDIGIGGTPFRVRGLQMIFEGVGTLGTGTMPASSIGLEMLSLNSLHLQDSAINLHDQLATTSAIKIGTISGTTNVPSMDIELTGRDGGGVAHTATFAADSTGDFVINTPSGAVPITPPQAFAALPTCAAGTEGGFKAVTNSTTAVWGNTITGGGGNHVMAYCDGTNWTVMGK